MTELTKAIDAVLDGVTTGTPRVPGVSAAVTDRRGTIYEGARGVRNTGTGESFEPDTVCAIFSTTKAIAGTACLQLVEEGLLDVSVRQSHLEPERDTKDARVRVTSLRTHEHFGNRVAKQADTAAACAGVQGKSGAGMPSARRVDCGRRAGQRPEREHGSQVGD